MFSTMSSNTSELKMMAAWQMMQQFNNLFLSLLFRDSMPFLLHKTVSAMWGRVFQWLEELMLATAPLCVDIFIMMGCE